MRNVLFFVGIILFLGACQQVNTAFKQVEIPRPETATYDMAQVEPSIAIDPNNTSIMIAGTVMDDFYHSSDGGKTWVSETLTCEYGVYGDPVMHIDQSGRWYYFHLSRKLERRMDRIVCQYKDGATDELWKTTYTEPTEREAQDKHWVAECPKTGNLYLSWTQFDKYGSTDPQDSSVVMFSRSEDNGQSWSTPVRISKLAGDCRDGNSTVEGAVPAVSADGTVYVVWTGPHGLRMNRSTDQGKTWLKEELFITEHIGGWAFSVPGIMRCNGLPIVKVDQSGGEFNGRIYVNWADQRNGADDTDVFLIYSDDEGQTWSEIKRVNQDTPGNQQFFTWMDIDQTDGNLYFVYHDRRDGNGNETGVYAAYSNNGGDAIRDFPVSKNLFLPEDEYFFGDYNNIAAHNGVIRPIWPEMNEGKISLYTALLNKRKIERKLKNSKL